MPNNLEEQIGKQASNMSRNRVSRIERIIYEIQDGVLVEEAAETIIGEGGIETIETTQSTLGECGHVVTKENIVRSSSGQLICSSCASMCSGDHCGIILSPNERHMLDGKAFCETCYEYEKARKFWPWL